MPITAERGETTCIMGKSQEGKTRLLLGFMLALFPFYDNEDGKKPVFLLGTHNEGLESLIKQDVVDKLPKINSKIVNFRTIEHLSLKSMKELMDDDEYMAGIFIDDVDGSLSVRQLEDLSKKVKEEGETRLFITVTDKIIAYEDVSLTIAGGTLTNNNTDEAFDLVMDPRLNVLRPTTPYEDDLPYVITNDLKKTFGDKQIAGDLGKAYVKYHYGSMRMRGILTKDISPERKEINMEFNDNTSVTTSSIEKIVYCDSGDSEGHYVITRNSVYALPDFYLGRVLNLNQ